jgi:hypothetical protein
MHLTLAYLGHSGLAPLPLLRGSGIGATRPAQALNLVPNLAREPVAFDAPLRHPLRFREAMSALHDVVVSDLRFRRRDRTAYEEWKQNEQERLRVLRREEYRQARDEILAHRSEPLPAGFETEYLRCRKRYWNARQQYADYLRKHDPALWRILMPCDPIVTVAPDAVLFECFSADESSYGCLTVERDGGFGPGDGAQNGTTNVDYSWQLYQHFQSLRSYRETRLRVDPAGFGVATATQPEYREEKIELPPGWLRGLLQIQAAMGLPMRRVSIPRDALYSVLAWHKRHRAHSRPRALRFELEPGRTPVLVMEPWEQRIACHGSVYEGPPGAPIRVWGQRRLLSLARLLPLAEGFDVYLLGTGLPSFWVARLGEMRLTLGLSGWTANDWTRGSALDLLAAPEDLTPELLLVLAQQLRQRHSATLAELAGHALVRESQAAAALNRLAHSGQVIYDLDAGRYRWRQVMPAPLAEDQLGPEDPEAAGCRELLRRRAVRLQSRQDVPEGGVLCTGAVGGIEVELLLDADGRIRRGRCKCSHHYKSGLRRGPCRHLQALRLAAWRPAAAQAEASAATWFERLQRWAWN